MNSSPFGRLALFLIPWVASLLVGENSFAQSRSRPRPTAPPAAYAPEPGYSSYPPEDAAREGKRTPDRIWQAKGGRFAATGELKYGFGRPEVRQANLGKIGDTSVSDFRLNFAGEYGITSHIAARARAFYGSRNEEFVSTVGGAGSSAKASGLGDLDIGAKLLYPVQYFLLSADLGIGVSLGNSKLAYSGRDGNFNSGGFSLNPSVGGAFYLGPAGWVGGLFTYRFKLERTRDEVSGATSKVQGGNEMAPEIFYEYQNRNLFVSPSLVYTIFDDERVNINGPTSTITRNSELQLQLKVGFYPIANLRLAGTYGLVNVPEAVGSAVVSSYYRHDFLLSARGEF